MQYLIGVDGGGTKTAFALAKTDGTVLRTLELDSTSYREHGIQKVIERLEEGVSTLLRQEGADRSKLALLAVGAPGYGENAAQDAVLSRVSIYGATFDLVACGILLAGMLFDPDTTAVFTLVSSALYYFSGTAPGSYSIAFLTGLGTLLCIFRRSYLQRCFSTIYICAAAGMMVYELMVFATGLFLGNTLVDRLGVFALCGGLSAAVMPLLYPVFLSISNIGGETWKE